ncbi:cupin domain-containing protein [Corticibacterium sp. UT-5YL-CI-8]|nr:cupin domain-containing protein [Tianweitania sp. UT-5YL-CI-8]
MTKFTTLDIDEADAELSAPPQQDIISGVPRFRHWPVDIAERGVSAGQWEATPGKWRFANDHWEYCRILTGVSVITEDGGSAQRVSAGDSFILRAGFSGTWEVIETTRKDYVIRG